MHTSARTNLLKVPGVPHFCCFLGQNVRFSIISSENFSFPTQKGRFSIILLKNFIGIESGLLRFLPKNLTGPVNVNFSPSWHDMHAGVLSFYNTRAFCFQS
ncbi:hypothetical protein R6Q59_027665 [Mikania micrantha]